VSHTLDRGEKPFTGGVKNSSSQGRRNFHPDSNKDRNKEIEKAPEVLVGDSFIRSNPELSAVWDKWLEHRRAKRWSTTNTYIAGWDEAFSQWGAAQAVQSINQSLLQGWQGLFEPKGRVTPRAQAPKSYTDHSKGF
jgi:hypothetical protein